MPRGGLPGIVSVQDSAPVLMAQAGDAALEEQMRALNGRVEELNFQILQLQEQIRKMQEDNEFRFQELEGGQKKTDAGGAEPGHKQAQADAAPQVTTSGASVTAAQPETQAATEPAGGGQMAAQPETTSTVAGAAPAQGEPERDFGTITFDQSGNVVGGSVGDQMTVSRDPAAALPQESGDAADGTVVAALPKTNDPEELYHSSYQLILGGNYRAAEAGFRRHAEQFPENARAADTQFWLGESLLSQQKYSDAAEVFLSGSKKYPKTKKAPEMLFKLGVSLVGINQRDVACATFDAVGKRYPDASGQLKKRVQQEQAKARC